jgi:hypothetical protein
MLTPRYQFHSRFELNQIMSLHLADQGALMWVSMFCLCFLPDVYPPELTRPDDVAQTVCPKSPYIPLA